MHRYRRGDRCSDRRGVHQCISRQPASEHKREVRMMSRLVGSMLLAGTIVLAGTSAIAQDLPKQSFKVLGTWSNLTNWQSNEQPLWTKTIPEASKGQITANIQSVSELGLKGTELIRLLKLGLFRSEAQT